MQTFERKLSPIDARVLHEAAQRGNAFLRWPEDRDWLEQLVGPGKALPRLNRMKRNGALAPVARGRWLVMPIGVSSLEQAASPKVLLAAFFEGRAQWYLGYLSALIDHRLTDIDADVVYAGVHIADGRRRWPSHVEIGALSVRIVQITRHDDWAGVERERVQGRVFAFRADLPRALIDTLDHPEHCGPPDVWVRAWERALRARPEEAVTLVERLIEYAEGRSTVVRARLAYWLRQTGYVRPAERVQRALGAPLKGRPLLDASRAFGPGPWQRDRETGLIVNMDERAIGGWLDYAK
jgi:predicted transcriptional regulator of viral defense system